MMNCPKCGKLIGHGTMGTVLPLCQCQWKNDVAIGMPSEAQLRCIELERQLAAEREARQRAEALCIQQGKQLGSITEKLIAAELRAGKKGGELK